MHLTKHIQVFQILHLTTYDITVASNANATGNAGGSTVVATQDRHLDQCQLFVPIMTLPGTSATTKLRTTTGKSIDGSQTAYSLTSSSEAFGVELGENVLFNEPQTVASSINETNEMSGNKSFQTIISLSSDQDNLSPAD